ncbi:MAG: hypothetical protein WC602_03915 [archaeon]
MANMTLAIPDSLRAKMRRHSEFRWSEVARKAFEKKLKEAELAGDLKAIAEAERERKAGKLISHKEVLKRLKIKAEDLLDD